MAAIVRVKRKNTDVPQDSLVIACKRPKTEACLSDTPPMETVVQFAGTLTDPTEDVTKHVAKILDMENHHRVGVKRTSDSGYPTNISGKIPKWTDERYKITDCQPLDTSNDAEFKDKCMMLIDVEDHWSTSHSRDEDEEDDEENEDIADYVYDLYYAQTSNDIWFESDNILVRRPEYSDVEFQDEDKSSDSNAESHWKNDYPDTDPDRSSKSSFFDDDHLDISVDESDFIENRRAVDEYGYSNRRRHKLDSSSDSDLWEESLSDKEEIVDEILDNEEISDDEGTETT